MDGCPAPAAYYPKTAVAVRQTGGGGYVTTCGDGRRLHTTSCSSLQQSMVYLDSFQAFDASTAEPGDPRLAARLYCRWEPARGSAVPEAAPDALPAAAPPARGRREREA
jgi:hypothetical protein